MNQEQKDLVENTINSNKIFVMLKGTPEQPRCGFSNRVVQVLNHFDIEYGSLNVFENIELMNLIKEYSNWPTIPQVYLKGEFLGGSDILIEMYNNGELKEKIEIELAS